MPTRNVVPSDHQHALVEMLVQSGRCTEVADDRLDEFVGLLGRSAAAKTRRSSR